MVGVPSYLTHAVREALNSSYLFSRYKKNSGFQASFGVDRILTLPLAAALRHLGVLSLQLGSPLHGAVKFVVMH